MPVRCRQRLRHWLNGRMELNSGYSTLASPRRRAFNVSRETFGPESTKLAGARAFGRSSGVAVVPRPGRLLLEHRLRPDRRYAWFISPAFSIVCLVRLSYRAIILSLARPPAAWHGEMQMSRITKSKMFHVKQRATALKSGRFRQNVSRETLSAS